VNDGRSDRQTGHSNRATQQQAYKNADHNYSPAYGTRDQYKSQYRQAYLQGYQQGYGQAYRR
jgi:flagellar biosynthesis/type III secretory pathway protein FliH